MSSTSEASSREVTASQCLKKGSATGRARLSCAFLLVPHFAAVLSPVQRQRKRVGGVYCTNLSPKLAADTSESSS